MRVKMSRLSEFSDKAMRFINTHPADDAPVTILHGSIRSTKTWSMNVKMIAQLNDYNVAGDRVIFGVSKDTIYHNVLNTIFDFVGKGNYKFNRSNGSLMLRTKKANVVTEGIWTVVGAKDEGSEKYIRGRTVGVAVGDEVTLTPQSFTNMMLSRMSPDGARFYGTTNPDNPFHYINTEYVSNEEKIKIGLVRAIQFNLDDNLSLSQAKRDQYDAMFKGVFHDRMIKGLWVTAEGAVYKDCLSVNNDPAICGENEYNDITRPTALSNTGGYTAMLIPIDYGTGNPTVFLLVIDDGETYWVDREYYWDSRAELRQKTDKEYVNDLKDFIAQYAPEGAECLVDPSAASLKAEMTMNGIWHSNAKNDVVEGIRIVSSLLAQRKIKIHKRCRKLLSELQVYKWDTKKQDKTGEDEVLKQHDHAPDALRYFCLTRVPSWRVSA
jgi:PBSX family phage terminase large subunit